MAENLSQGSKQNRHKLQCRAAEDGYLETFDIERDVEREGLNHLCSESKHPDKLCSGYTAYRHLSYADVAHIEFRVRYCPCNWLRQMSLKLHLCGINALVFFENNAPPRTCSSGIIPLSRALESDI